jgi:hypothetical protein
MALPHPLYRRPQTLCERRLVSPLPSGHALPIWPFQALRKREEAARQRGGLFFRENSSNGGKAIRTFWRNTKFGKMTCQG